MAGDKSSTSTGSRANDAFPRATLPADLQKLVDKQDDYWEDVYDGAGPDTTETNMRYAAYANRLRTIMLSAQRYVAYTSDIGESFRPVAHPYLVRGAYAVSWAYILGDVGHEGYKAYKRNQRLLYPQSEEYHDATTKGPAEAAQSPAPTKPVQLPAIEDYRSVMVQRAVFQSLASMGLPAFTIHSIVKYSGKALKNAKNTTIRTWGPIGLGLAAVPALPYLFDKPVEEAVEWTFYQAFRAIGGESAVGDRHATGREKTLQSDAKAAKAKKEL
ncbi:hypothetical protein A1O1_03605 [Capronia coronata CBS 617.96]|uniref:Mitochondrial fission process protein 1 n=1 Tax=Capronia coronata CBS 617.96 TaxID=1182541 RepID=W9YC99_9EURO|nr:uncharacterized protein A1O1_03605 [Capronia coronata CBS 617.96]EXJ90502.1 hypothetical protein A1O1_03605 [Capronia coronata CBS 617.96]